MVPIFPGGYANKDAVYQDNQSSILLENNDIYSAGKGNKQIHIQYYFVTNHIKIKNLKVMLVLPEKQL